MSVRPSVRLVAALGEPVDALVHVHTRVCCSPDLNHG